MVWESENPMGIDEISNFALGKYTTENIYTISNDDKRSLIRVYTLDGDLLYETVGTRIGSQESAKETIDITSVADIDQNGFLDILMGTNIKASSVNIHRLYRLQRIPEAGLDRFYNRFVWMVKDTGKITSISFVDFNNDNYLDILTSSVDDKIKVYNFFGELIFETDLGLNVWDVKMYIVGVTPIERESGYEKVINSIDEESSILAATHDGLYLLTKNGSFVWKAGAGNLMLKAGIYDINSDGVNEYFGVSNGKIYAFNSSGEQIWIYEKRDVSDIAFSNMFGLGKKHVLTSSGDTLIFLSEFGEEVWTMDLGEKIKSYKQVSYKDSERIFVGTDSSLKSFKVNDEPFKYSQALDNYEIALVAFEKHDFNKSMIHSNISHTLFRSLRDILNESEALNLYLKSLDFNEAYNFMRLSEESLAKGKLEEGSEYSRKAFELFAKHGYLESMNSNDERVLKLKAQLAEAMTQITRRDTQSLAQKHYDLAEDHYVSLAYANAIKDARIAFQLYSEINDTTGANLAKKLMDLIEDSQTTTTTTTIPVTTTTTVQEFRLKKDDIIFYAALTATLLVIASVIIPRIRKK